jgi:pyruvate dehydrogenase E2 component (dihydrolipoamide acetyltransferase)
VVEIPSPYAGTVLRHGGGEGETIAVGSVLVVIGEDGEIEEVAQPSPSTTVPEPAAVASAAPIVGTLSEEAEVLSTRAAEPSRAGPGEVKALPIVRKLARDLGVDLSTIPGTGPDGRITREDVLGATAPAPPPAAPTPSAEPAGIRIPPSVSSPAPVPSGPPAGGDERQPLTRLRRTIAANMAKSWAEIPHVTTFDDVDATRMLDVRQALGARHGVKIPIEALVVKAVIPVLRAFPDFNSSIDGDELVVHGAHDIGIAVDTPDGLLVAVIRDAASRSVLDLATEVRRLGEGGKERSLSPDELGGQTFTVSNIGALGGGHGTPLVPHGTTAILSVGMAKDKPVARDGSVVVAPVMPLSLSYDHRVIDGGLGRRFMALLIENLEEPALFLAE